jgi:hypothetical protein
MCPNPNHGLGGKAVQRVKQQQNQKLFLSLVYLVKEKKKVLYTPTL